MSGHTCSGSLPASFSMSQNSQSPLSNTDCAGPQQPGKCMFEIALHTLVKHVHCLSLLLWKTQSLKIRRSVSRHSTPTIYSKYSYNHSPSWASFYDALCSYMLFCGGVALHAYTLTFQGGVGEASTKPSGLAELLFWLKFFRQRDKTM